MKLLRQAQKGFTLLELILALGIVGFIVSISLGAIRLGTSAQEIGHIKIDTFQRLRFIQNQITQKIKSTYPVFIFHVFHLINEILAIAHDVLPGPHVLIGAKGAGIWAASTAEDGHRESQIDSGNLIVPYVIFNAPVIPVRIGKTLNISYPVSGFISDGLVLGV